MFTGNTTVESSSGEVQITDVSVEGMEVLLRYVHLMYMYFSHVSKEKINSDLMMAAKQLQCRGACQ
jgi:hypothetical protein